MFIIVILSLSLVTELFTEFLLATVCTALCDNSAVKVGFGIPGSPSNDLVFSVNGALLVVFTAIESVLDLPFLQIMILPQTPQITHRPTIL